MAPSPIKIRPGVEDHQHSTRRTKGSVWTSFSCALPGRRKFAGQGSNLPGREKQAEYDAPSALPLRGKFFLTDIPSSSGTVCIEVVCGRGHPRPRPSDSAQGYSFMPLLGHMTGNGSCTAQSCWLEGMARSRIDWHRIQNSWLGLRALCSFTAAT